MEHEQDVEMAANWASLVSLQNLLFISLFAFRYLRLIVHIISFWLYQASPVPETPTVKRQDVTVVIPTIDPRNQDFLKCLLSVLHNQPAEILIVTVGTELMNLTEEIVQPIRQQFPQTLIKITATKVANKRRQVAHVLGCIKTDITVLVDDHVFWPSTRFLPSILAPFENPQVGGVGTNKRVVRESHGFGARSFWNIIGALYLERHNFEIRASNAVDGGVFVISGRSCAYRSHILQDPNFIDGFTNERFFFGLFGPLNPDDDNFITRWLVRHGWQIKIQYTDDSLIETTLGTYPKFMSQAVRWARTTFRSNLASLLTDRTVWTAQPWCVYAVYISGMINFALFYDAAMLYALSLTTFYDSTTLTALVCWIFASKLVKIIPYFLRNPRDLIYLPACIAFAYFHSFIKLYAMLTFWETNWGGRNLAAIDSKASEETGNEMISEEAIATSRGPADDLRCRDHTSNWMFQDHASRGPDSSSSRVVASDDSGFLADTELSSDSRHAISRFGRPSSDSNAGTVTRGPHQSPLLKRPRKQMVKLMALPANEWRYSGPGL
ncbi:hypothetical protein B0A52_05461 [Exophiala mesophila]|uniref:Glycosyltransferase 2-like domain-containing protein n=1 Tax=Exophiala mesophila TaxID=212818 RepID=A0A438N5G9_EXOME|nr:hypothetical protein B0A52_05461 [Exophiala mesophila]